MADGAGNEASFLSFFSSDYSVIFLKKERNQLKTVSFYKNNKTRFIGSCKIFHSSILAFYFIFIYFIIFEEGKSLLSIVTISSRQNISQ